MRSLPPASSFTTASGSYSAGRPEDHAHEVTRQIDVALLPVNGLIVRPLLYRKVVMDDVEAAKLCGILHPRVAIPIHYAFTAGNLRNHVLLKYTGTAKGFVEAVPTYSPSTEARVLQPGESVTVSPT